MTDLDPQRYPVGRFQPPQSFTPQERQERIAILAALPQQLHTLLDALRPEQWQRQYRPGGWTVQQVVHHVADSHLNAYVRIKLALTQAEPAVNAYDEARWAELPDVAATPAAVSLPILDGVHVRLVALLRALDEADFQKCMRHPEWGPISVDFVVALYAWHSQHHSAHIRAALA